MSLQVEAAARPALKRPPRAVRQQQKRKRLSPGGPADAPPPGLYVHSSPPRVLHMNASQIRQWLRGGDLDRLEAVVLEGQGHKLVGEYSPDPKVRAFLKTVPSYMAKMEILHEAAARGADADVRALLADDPRGRRLALCKDAAGVGLLHKAAFHDRQPLLEWLAQTYPATLALRDREGRTALHYVGRCSKPQHAWELLVAAGADQAALDARGRDPAYYVQNARELELPGARTPTAPLRRFTSGRDGFVVTRANIRIWIHDRDFGRLQQMLWEGHGDKLRVETSNHPKVKRLLDAVPYIMGTIRDVHRAVVDDDEELLQQRAADPVPPAIFGSKDQNGLTPLMKAAGLGRASMLRSMLAAAPAALEAADGGGRRALHWAALAAARGDPQCLQLLQQAGADAAARDAAGHEAAFYLQNARALDASLLKAVPDAPRTAAVYPPAWDWRLLSAMDGDYAGGFGPPLQGRGAAAAGAGAAKLAALDPPEERAEDEEEDEGVGEEGDQEDDASERQRALEAEELEQRLRAEEEEAERLRLEAEEAERLRLEEEEQAERLRLEEEEAERLRLEEEEAERLRLEEEEAERLRLEEEEEAERLRLEEKEAERLRLEEEERQRFDEAESQRLEAEERERFEEEQRRLEEEERLRAEEEAAADGSGEEEAAAEAAAAAAEGAGADGEGAGAERWERADDEAAASPLDDAEARALVAEGDLEKLAGLVLAGQGSRLLGLSSDDPETQSFLANVPSYLAKIGAVHAAARDGRLRDLQAALDRRRFAVARDPAAPLLCTPLHAAVLHARVDVARYLGGRFPETLNVGDADDRTPLHYAAALHDNGHLYNVLLNLGANPTLKDNRGRTAEYYMQHRDRLLHKKLLADYGSPENIADETFGDQVRSRMEPVFWTEEGRYLAAALGDPLIKGLMEIAEVRPSDPIAYLATYLYNFANKNKSRVGTQESAVLIAAAAPEAAQWEPQGAPQGEPQVEQIEQQTALAQPPPGQEQDAAEADSRPPSPADADSSATRDEHGQSMLHFAAARPHGRGALLQLLLETRLNVGFRDELYRTARDVAAQAALPDNIRDIDRWLLHLAAHGETQRLTELLLEGYDHLLDVEDDEGAPILEVADSRKQHETLELLESIPAFEERRERLHAALRRGDMAEAADLLSAREGGAALLAAAKNVYGRCSLHIAVLRQNADAVELIAARFPHTLRVGDNLERTALHYAMGVEQVEQLSAVLIRAGAKRVLKDLKGRQPSYYFMNRSDILRLQDEESLNM